MENQAKSETEAIYFVAPDYTKEDDAIIARALMILEDRMVRATEVFSASHEVFSVLLLNAQHGLLAHVELFRGTLMQTSVYPREVVKIAMQHNAAAVILTHNHPSGSLVPSRADEALTKTLKDALSLVDVRVLDHIITSGGAWKSMAAMGIV